MNASVRRAVAYVAARAATGRTASSLYDYDAGTYSNFSGQVSESYVSVYDFAAACHISGSRSKGQISLYHFGVQGHLTIHIRPSGTFDGYDYSSNSHFSGSVNGSAVQLYDYSSGKFFNYSV